MLGFDEEVTGIHEELKSLIPEYPLHFLDLTRFEHLEYFQTELRPLLALYRRRNQGKKEFVEYIKANEGQWEMGEEAWYLLGQLTRSGNLKEWLRIKNAKEEEEEGSMFRALDELVDDARAEGRVTGKAEMILELLEEYGEVPVQLREEIQEQKESEILRKWCRLAAKVSDIQEFIDKKDDKSICFE